MAGTRIETLKEMHLTADLREGSEIVVLLSAGGVTAPAGTDKGTITALSRT